MPSAFTNTELACAKINLALHVRAREPDGYHRIETLFAFAAAGDLLSAAPSDTLSLAITGPFAQGLSAGPDNLVLRAAHALREAFDVGQGAALALDKQLPVASGLGGGSADAAAALRLLARLWELPVDDPRIAAIACELGADVPACLLSATCRGEGRGDLLTPLDAPGLRAMPLLLVNPGVAVPTGPVFRGWGGVDRGALGQGDPLASAVCGRNDLEPPARALQPVIGEVVAHLARQPGVALARMSGSGATCFALFDSMSARDAAAAAIPSGWWHMSSELR